MRNFKRDVSKGFYNIPFSPHTHTHIYPIKLVVHCTYKHHNILFHFAVLHYEPDSLFYAICIRNPPRGPIASIYRVLWFPFFACNFIYLLISRPRFSSEGRRITCGDLINIKILASILEGGVSRTCRGCGYETFSLAGIMIKSTIIKYGGCSIYASLGLHGFCFVLFFLKQPYILNKKSFVEFFDVFVLNRRLVEYSYS